MSGHKHWETDKRYVLCDRTGCDNSYSSKNVEMLGSPLVPQEAVDAAHYSYTDGYPLAQVLDDAAPYIAAKALRDAARMVEPGKVRPAAAISSFRYGDLMRLADELEAGEQG